MNERTGDTTKRWFEKGFGLHVVEQLHKRDNRAYLGLTHLGKIHTGHWIATPGKAGRAVRDTLSLYNSEDEFLND